MKEKFLKFPEPDQFLPQKIENKTRENFEPLKVNVEMATEDQWEKYKNIWLKAVKEDPVAFSSKKLAPKFLEKQNKKTEEDWRNDLSTPERKFFFLADNPENLNEAIGMGGAVKQENQWRILHVFTEEKFKKRTISKQIMKQIFERLKNLKAKEIYLFVNKSPKQEAAHNFYHKLGFIIAQPRTFREKIGTRKQDWYTMELDLTNPEVIKKINEVLNAG